MRTWLRCCLVVLLMISASVSPAQQLKTLPEPGKLLGYVAAEEPGKWLVFGPGGITIVQPTVIDGGKAVFWQGAAGEYAVVFLPPGDAQPLPINVVLGGPAPGPDPPDPPTPEPSGAKQIMMFYSGDQLDNLPAAQRELLTSLKLRQELVKAGHVVLEMVEASALSGAAPARYKAFFDAARDQPMPVLVYAPKTGGKVTAVPLPADRARLLEVLR